jgi:predicted ribosomally synthesized peptide with nif11-like leader
VKAAVPAKVGSDASIVRIETDADGNAARPGLFVVKSGGPPADTASSRHDRPGRRRAARPEPRGGETMKDQGVNDFIARMEKDEAFRKEVLASEVGEDRLAYVNGEGFDVTAQELVDATSQLADAELDAVHGGSQTNENNILGNSGSSPQVIY